MLIRIAGCSPAEGERSPGSAFCNLGEPSYVDILRVDAPAISGGRAGRWRGRLQVTDRAHDAGQARAGLCLVLRGRWRCGTQVLEPGQGLWWSERSAENALEPLDIAAQGQAKPALAWIDLDMPPSD